MTLHPHGRLLLLENALEFAAGARNAVCRDRDFRGIFLQHVGIAIELSLKSFLQCHGWSDERCRVELRHDLVRALAAARKLGLRPSDPDLARIVAVLSPFYRRHATAELAAQAPEPLEPERTLQVMERLLDDVRAATSSSSTAARRLREEED
ncbi:MULTISPECIES: hypothetical protein [Hyphomicrobiales]|jgi:hypothetical protein|uniref:hypothetical protein n=1 Tax=Hyphomicrobiales TaxID=356 RepID=UPI000DAEC964|nr:MULTISPECIES: hypothetical protein [Hyphomicrobiales]RAI36660.1 hypothetical protein CH340_02440 [Rhodoplanes serenus]RVO59166.1 hypothetical protein CN092_07795 [Sinorhizobium meliloti]HET6377262.1 hypothetical protein [Methylocella sp.]